MQAPDRKERSPWEEHRKRLRERFEQTERDGLAGFHDHEILEMTLTCVIPRRDVKPVARALLARFKSVRGVFEAPREALLEVKGIGPASATLLRFLRALLARLMEDRLREPGIPLNSPRAVADYLRLEMAGLRDESIRALYLDAKNVLLDSEEIQRGTVDQAAAYPRKILDRALRANAVALILAHNHPSGDPTPSEEDRQLTRRLSRALDAAEIRLHDHIVIGRDRHFSFREAGWLKE